MKNADKAVRQTVAQGYSQRSTSSEADVVHAVAKEVVNGKDAIRNAILVLRKALKKDDGYYQSWQANIAMAFQDEHYRFKFRNNKPRISNKDVHTVANKAADNFLQLLFELK